MHCVGLKCFLGFNLIVCVSTGRLWKCLRFVLHWWGFKVLKCAGGVCFEY